MKISIPMFQTDRIQTGKKVGTEVGHKQAKQYRCFETFTGRLTCDQCGQSSSSSSSLPSGFSCSRMLSDTMFSHCKVHMSVHLSPAFKQQHVSTDQTLLHVQDNSSRTSSGAGLVPSQTNSTSFDVLHTCTFQPCP